MKAFAQSAGALAALTAATGMMGSVPRVQAVLPSAVTALMDESVDPCDDFYQYACGTWIKNTPLPGDVDLIGYEGDMIDDRNQIVLHEIYESGKPILGELWDSCMDVDTINAIGNKPMQSALENVQSVGSKSELFKVAGQLGQTGPFVISGISVGPDTKNVTTNRLFVTPGTLTLPYTSYYTNPDTFSFIEPDFRSYIAAVFNLSGYTPTGANKSIDAAVDVVVNLERQLANITDATTDADDPDAFYNPVTYRDTIEKYPVTVGQFATGLGLLENSKLTEDSVVISQSLDYFDVVEQLVGELALDDLKTYLAFSYINNGAQYLSDPFYKAYFDLFLDTLQGQQNMLARTRICSDVEIDYLPDLVGNYYFQRVFDSEREQNAKLMVKMIEETMKEHMDKLT